MGATPFGSSGSGLPPSNHNSDDGEGPLIFALVCLVLFAIIMALI